MMKCLMALLLMIFLPGCTMIYQNVKQDDPSWAPSFAEELDYQDNGSGAIFNHATAKTLFQDKKALRVGDIITVILSENTSATKKADTEYSKETGVSTSIPTLFGNSPSLGAGTLDLSIAINSANDFKAETDTKQSNLLKGTISVTVHRVYGNGNLMIRGEKWIGLNQGKEYIRISGLIRPEDITKDNQILSSKVANARIYYGGTGPLAETNEEGWLSRFFNSGWWPL